MPGMWNEAESYAYYMGEGYWDDPVEPPDEDNEPLRPVPPPPPIDAPDEVPF